MHIIIITLTTKDSNDSKLIQIGHSIKILRRAVIQLSWSGSHLWFSRTYYRKCLENVFFLYFLLFGGETCVTIIFLSLQNAPF